MVPKVNITSKGICKVLKHYTTRQAIAEYIWNGFDAGADIVHLDYAFDDWGNTEHLSVRDNGKGIDLEKLSAKFNPFYDSEKAVAIAAPKHTSMMHGKNGVGRLTFFTFAGAANWDTTFYKEGQLSCGSIQILAEGLNTYKTATTTAKEGTATGTHVSFQQINISREAMDAEIIPFLLSEFCWFLELNKHRNICLYVNGIPLDYSVNIEAAEENIDICYTQSNTRFTLKFVQWKNPLHKELSKYYFLNEQQEEVYKDYTTLNKKCDEFYHSLYIQSDFFNDFDFKSAEDQIQSNIFGKAKSAPEYKYLIKNINEYLKKKRKPYLRLYASRLLAQYEQEGILPLYTTETEERYNKPWLTQVLTALYELNPRLFNNLNTEQKKMMIRLIDLLLHSGQKEAICVLLKDIIIMEPEESKELFHYIHNVPIRERIAFENYERV